MKILKKGGIGAAWVAGLMLLGCAVWWGAGASVYAQNPNFVKLAQDSARAGMF